MWNARNWMTTCAAVKGCPALRRGEGALCMITPADMAKARAVSPLGRSVGPPANSESASDVDEMDLDAGDLYHDTDSSLSDMDLRPIARALREYLPTDEGVISDDDGDLAYAVGNSAVSELFAGLLSDSDDDDGVRICLSCGGENGAAATYCLHCGRRLDDWLPEHVRPVTQKWRDVVAPQPAATPAARGTPSTEAPQPAKGTSRTRRRASLDSRLSKTMRRREGAAPFADVKPVPPTSSRPSSSRPSSARSHRPQRPRSATVAAIPVVASASQSSRSDTPAQHTAPTCPRVLPPRPASSFGYGHSSTPAPQRPLSASSSRRPGTPSCAKRTPEGTSERVEYCAPVRQEAEGHPVLLVRPQTPLQRPPSASLLRPRTPSRPSSASGCRVVAGSQSVDETLGTTLVVARKTLYNEGPALSRTPSRTQLVEYRREAPRAIDWQRVPDEILLEIFRWLSLVDLAQCARVSRRFRRVVYDRSLWRVISVSGRQLNDDAVSSLGLRGPRAIALSRCTQVTTRGIQRMVAHSGHRLLSLDLSGTSGVDDAAASAVADNCGELLDLDLSWCKIGDVTAIALARGCPVLRRLRLRGCERLSDAGVARAVCFVGGTLEALDLFGCYNIGDGAIDAVAQQCRTLVSLSIGQCSKVSDAALGRFAAAVPGLLELDARGCKKVRDDALLALAKSCAGLRSLALGFCALITDTGVTEIARRCRQLSALDLGWCINVSDESMRRMAADAPALELLDLSATNITAMTVEAIGLSALRLGTLKLNYCCDITASCVAALLVQSQSIRDVHLYGCKRIGDVAALRALNPAATIHM